MSTNGNQSGIPEAFSTVTPYLIVDDGPAAIDFYQATFDAVELMRVNMPDGRMAHAEIRIGDSPVMIGERSDDFKFMKSATDLGGAAVNFYLYLPDADAVFDQAVRNGSDVVMVMEDHDDGDRRGGIRDPFGLIWWLASTIDPAGRERMMSEQDVPAS